MSRDTENFQDLIDQLEQTLSELDSINAKIAAIHVDIAIVELCKLADIERSGRNVQAA